MKPRTVIACGIVALFLVAAGVAVWLLYLRASLPRFEDVGGTILVYEIMPDKQKADGQEDLAEKLVIALNSRLDGDRTGFVTVQGAAKDQVAIRIARVPGQNHRDEVTRVKQLVSRAGELEFRILANDKDDRAGIDAARFAIRDAHETPGLMEKLAEAGLPPPAPMSADDPTRLEVFTVLHPNGHQSLVTYSWLELGPQQRTLINLDNAARNEAVRNATWLEATKDLNTPVQLNDLAGRRLMQGALFLVRHCQDQNLAADERRSKEFEVFVLARDPEVMERDKQGELKRTPKLRGSHLSSVFDVASPDGRPAIHFSMSTAGADLLGELSRKNVPSPGEGGESIKRHLAIVLDGQVMTAPTINSEIREQGQISGLFTPAEVDNLVKILRAGALPARLKPMPVSEEEVAPKKQ